MTGRFKAPWRRPIAARFGLGGRLGQEIARAAIGSTGVRLAGTALAFGVGVQLARYLGPAQYGAYGTVMAIVALLVVPSQFGLTQLMVREVAVHSSRRDSNALKGALIGLSFAMILALTITTILTWIVIRLFSVTGGRPDDYNWLLAIAPIYTIISFGAGVLRGLGKVVLSSSFDALLRPALFGISLFTAMSAQGYVTVGNALFLNFATAATALVLMLWSIRRAAPTGLLSVKATYKSRFWLMAAVPMFSTELLRTLDAQVGILVMNFTATATEIGYFRVAASTAIFYAQPLTVLNLVLLPYIARLNAQGQTDQLQKLMGGAALAAILGTSTLVIVTLVAGSQLVTLAFGERYINAWTPLIILALSQIVAATFGANAALLNMANEEGSVTIGFLIGLVVTVSMTLILVVRFGASGVAAAVVSGSIARGAWLNWQAKRKLGIDSGLLAIIYLVKTALLGRKGRITQ